MAKSKQEKELDTPLDEAVAKQFGLKWDPDNPPTLRQVLQAQLASTLNFFRDQATQSRAQVQEMRDRFTKRSDLSPDKKAAVEEITKILEMYPQLIGPCKVHLATMLRRVMAQEKLLAACPEKVLDLLDKMEQVLRDEIPEDIWPENLAAAAQAAAGNETAATG
jgi:hypothetical protein